MEETREFNSASDSGLLAMLIGLEGLLLFRTKSSSGALKSAFGFPFGNCVVYHITLRIRTLTNK